MIVYKKTRGELLLPVFLGILLAAMAFLPAKTALAERASNTDTYTGTGRVLKKISQIASLDETEVNGLDVPKLGGAATIATATKTEVAATPSPCAETPDPGANQISVCGRVIPLVYNNFYAQVTPANGTAVKWTYRNFIFGHNSADVFGGLHNLLRAGDPLKVNYGGGVQTYHYQYFRLNSSLIDVDEEFKPYNTSGRLGLMTCAAWVTDGTADLSRYGFVFEM